MRIDLNCDLGEGAGQDAELMPLVTSANIACGGHAGDEETMRSTVELARRWGVNVGAHPGFDDREHFGRRELRLPVEEIARSVRRQVLALREFGPVNHIKPHGALYNLAARDRAVAEAVSGAVHSIDPALVLFALAGSELVTAGRNAGLKVVEEVFADRMYRRDGSLVPRSEPNALVADEEKMVAQVLRMIREGRVETADGGEARVTANTICLHGDGPHAVAFARELRQELERAGIEIATP